jgi:hypothetical protein
VNLGGLKLLVHKKLVGLSTQEIRAWSNLCAQGSCLPVGRLSAIDYDVLANKNDSGESVKVEELLGEILP